MKKTLVFLTLVCVLSTLSCSPKTENKREDVFGVWEATKESLKNQKENEARNALSSAADASIAKLSMGGIAMCLLDNGQWTPFEEIKNNKWLKGNIIRFDYINDEFIRSQPYWDSDD